MVRSMRVIFLFHILALVSMEEEGESRGTVKGMVLFTSLDRGGVGEYFIANINDSDIKLHIVVFE